jgi:hemerythrin superfamily protein
MPENSAQRRPAPKRSAKKTAKTDSAKKTAGKSAAGKKGTTKKSAAKKSAAKKSSTKKSAAKKSTAKQSTGARKNPAAKGAATTKRAGRAAARTHRRDGLDALQVLIGDHELVNDLFDEFESLGRRAHHAREQVVLRIVEELSVHAGIEETVFYPAVREQLAGDESMVMEALEEHHLVKVSLSELQSMSSDNERYDAKMTVLREVVDHHVDEEENELFPKVRRAFSDDELLELGRQLEQARLLAPKRAHPSAPDEPPGNLVANVLVAPLDVATNLTSRAAGAVRELMD